MSARCENAVDGLDEARDGLLVHLLQGGAGAAPVDALVAIGQLVENAAILRVEEGERDGLIRQPGEEVQPVHLSRASNCSPSGSFRSGVATSREAEKTLVFPVSAAGLVFIPAVRERMASLATAYHRLFECVSR